MTLLGGCKNAKPDGSTFSVQFCEHACTGTPKCLDVYMLSTCWHSKRIQPTSTNRRPLQVPDLQLGPAAPFANDSQLFFPVAALLESSVPEESKAALQVLLCVIVAASMTCLHHSLSLTTVCNCNVSKQARVTCLWAMHIAVQLCFRSTYVHCPVYEASAVCVNCDIGDAGAGCCDAVQ